MNPTDKYNNITQLPFFEMDEEEMEVLYETKLMEKARNYLMQYPQSTTIQFQTALKVNKMTAIDLLSKVTR